ncbi:MAG: nitroreductase family protein [Elusimicrobiales bacterium]|nr:nitroreductase family protein [Elusimicrobiales bacterium]
MELEKILKERRSYRSLETAPVTDALIGELAQAAALMPSCFNNQPWRFVFARDPRVLEKLHGALSKGNEWAKAAPLIVAVFGRKDSDCVLGDREYYQFDIGLGTAGLVLRAWDLGLMAHPIAGYDPEAAAAILGIPAEFRVITLLIVAKKSAVPNPLMTEKQASAEAERPPRLAFEKFAWIDSYKG